MRRRGRDRQPARGLSVHPDWRYRVMWTVDRIVIRALFRVRSEGLDRWPEPPFLLACNHHNGGDPLLVFAVAPFRPRITWFGPREADFSRGFKNRVMAFFGGVIPYDPRRTAPTSAVRAVRRVFAAGGVLGIFVEGRIGFRESELLPLEEGAVGFASAAGVPIVPCAIVGSSRLWWRRRITVRCGTAIPTAGLRGRAARSALETQVRDAIVALLPRTEPSVPAGRPLAFLTDLLNGPEEAAARRAEHGER